MSLFTDKIEIEVQEAELVTQKALADFPPLLRWMTILVAIAIIPAYFIAKNVSHGIWQNRYGQGALMAKPSFTNPLPPKASNVFLTTLGQNNYAAAVLLTNQNLDLSVNNAAFEFDFLNAQKQQVYSYTGNLFLLPNESKYIVVPTFTAQDKIAYASFQIPGSLNWQKRINIPKIDISTSLPTDYSQTNPPAFVVEGSYTNNSPYQFEKVQLTFVLTDPSGTIVGLSTRDESTVAPFELRSYKQLWPNMSSSNIASVKIFAETNVLDPSNITLPDYNSGGASDLSRPGK
jgi:hypothetical protein